MSNLEAEEMGGKEVKYTLFTKSNEKFIA